MSASNKVYDIVNEKILAMLEEGNIPWRKPWNCTAAGAPRNLISGKPYRGINAFLLAADNRFTSPYWLTMKQANERGARIRKGEKSTLVIFWKLHESKTETVTTAKGTRAKMLPVLRYYLVFNAEQCEGLDYPKQTPEEARGKFSAIEAAEKIVASYVLGPSITHGGDRAFYRPSTDAVRMPEKEAFSTPEEYYSTLFHELTHSTGHERRLNREGITAEHSFGDEIYSKEELVAEFGAAFLCGVSGIVSTFKNSAAYIQNWSRAIKANRTWIVTAAAQAQKAADLVQGIQHGKPEADPEEVKA